MKEIRVIDAFPPADIRPRPYCVATLTRSVVERNRIWAARKDVPRQMREREANGVAIDQCGNKARYSINARLFCRKHGALHALDLVAEKLK